MAWRTHAGIALRPTGNLQGSVKFYRINTGGVLKRRSFTPTPMPDQVIKRVNAIGEQEGQGRKFRFKSRRHEPYKWTDEVPKDNPVFQSLLSNDEEMALYPDISAELPGVELEEDECNYQTTTDKPKAEFHDLAGSALHNAGINADNMLCAAQARVAAEVERQGPALVEANEDKVVYKITFNLLDAGLPPANANLKVPLGDDRDNTAAAVVIHDNNKEQRYSLQAHGRQECNR